jgi:DNA-directed RNA polymerase subunit RPC12/RpoP
MMQEYTCGACGETFGTNFAEHEIECAYCDARRCPCCQSWFGGQQ